MHYEIADWTSSNCLHFDDDWNHSPKLLWIMQFFKFTWCLTCTVHPDLHLSVLSQATNDPFTSVVTSIAYGRPAFSSSTRSGGRGTAVYFGHIVGWRMSLSLIGCVHLFFSVFNYSDSDNWALASVV